MLKVAKAMLRVRGFRGSLEMAHHGLQDLSAGAAAPQRVTLKVKGPSAPHPRVFRELLQRIGHVPPPAGTRYLTSELMAQVVVGHRLWREATQEDERFLVVEDIKFMQNKIRKEVWLRLYVDWPTMRRHGMKQKDLLQASGLGAGFALMKDPTVGSDRLCPEQVVPLSYTRRATDRVTALVASIRPLLWRIVSAVPGSSYQRYYLYRCPPGGDRASQIEAMWALIFYLGSVVRYRPHRFDEITNGHYGPFADEFIAVQAEQLLYLLASEICRRAISRPAII